MKYKLKARLLTGSIVVATAVNSIPVVAIAQNVGGGVDLNNPASTDISSDIFDYMLYEYDVDTQEYALLLEDSVIDDEDDTLDVEDNLDEELFLEVEEVQDDDDDLLLEEDILDDEDAQQDEDEILLKEEVQDDDSHDDVSEQEDVLEQDADNIELVSDVETIAVSNLDIGTGNTDPLFDDTGESWTALTEADFRSGGQYYATGELPSGNYYLSGNLLLNRNIVIADDAIVEINLNGNVLDGADGTNSGDVITVGSNAKLTIDDISSDGDTRYSFWHNNDYYLTNNLDDVTDKSLTIDGGFIKSGSSVIGTVLTGGVITGGYAYYSWNGAGVYLENNSELVLNGGNISGNSTNGIYVNYGSKLTTNNTNISDNIYDGVYINSEGDVYFNNTTILGNNNYGIQSTVNCAITLNNIIISYNNTGLHLNGYLDNGTIYSPNVNMSGKIIINDNISTDCYVNPYSFFYITDALDNDSIINIRFTEEDDFDVDSFVIVEGSNYIITQDDFNKIKLDEVTNIYCPAYELQLSTEDNVIKLVNTDFSFIENGNKDRGTIENIELDNNENWIPLTTKDFASNGEYSNGILEEGNYYLSYDVYVSTPIQIAENSEVNISLNGNALLYNNANNTWDSAITVNSNATLNLYDTIDESLLRSKYGYWVNNAFNVVYDKSEIPISYTIDENGYILDEEHNFIGKEFKKGYIKNNTNSDYWSSFYKYGITIDYLGDLNLYGGSIVNFYEGINSYNDGSLNINNFNLIGNKYGCSVYNLKDISIKNSDVLFNNYNGIYISSVENLFLENVNIEYNNNGLYLSSVENLSLENVNIEYNNDGLYLNSIGILSLENVEIEYNNNGVYLNNIYNYIDIKDNVKIANNKRYSYSSEYNLIISDGKYIPLSKSIGDNSEIFIDVNGDPGNGYIYIAKGIDGYRLTNDDFNKLILTDSNANENYKLILDEDENVIILIDELLYGSTKDGGNEAPVEEEYNSYIPIKTEDFLVNGSYDDSTLPTGDYYLSGHVNLQKTLIIPEGETVKLYLNDNALIGIGGVQGGNVIEVYGELEIYDVSEDNASEKYLYTDNDTDSTKISTTMTISDEFIDSITGGVITGTSSNGQSNIPSGIYISGDNAKLYMYGGNLVGNTYGIYSQGNTNILVNNSNIYNNSSSGISIHNNINNSIISNSNIYGNSEAIYSNFSDINIENNDIYENSIAIYSYYSDINIENNDIYENSIAIYSNYSDINIENNDIYENSTAISSNYSDINIDNNNIYKNSTAIYSYYSDINVDNNYIYENSEAIYGYYSDINIENTNFNDNYWGNYMDNSTLNMKNSNIFDSSYYGIRIYSSEVDFENVSIINNNYDTAVYLWDSTLNMKDGELKNNGTGIEVDYNSTLNLDDSVIEDNKYQGIYVYYYPYNNDSLNGYVNLEGETKITGNGTYYNYNSDLERNIYLDGKSVLTLVAEMGNSTDTIGITPGIEPGRGFVEVVVGTEDYTITNSDFENFDTDDNDYELRLNDEYNRIVLVHGNELEEGIIEFPKRVYTVGEYFEPKGLEISAMSWEGSSGSTKVVPYEGNEDCFKFSIDTTQAFTKEQNGTRVIVTYTDENVSYNSTYSFILEVNEFFTVKGVVYDSDDDVIEGAVVNIRKNAETIHQTTTNSNGEFYFDNVEEDNYNLVARLHDDDDDIQRIVERISVHENIEKNIYLLPENTTTGLLIEEDDNNIITAVGGLTELAEQLLEDLELAVGETVDFLVTIDSYFENEGNSIVEDRFDAVRTSGEFLSNFLDINLSQTVKDENGDIVSDKTKEILEIDSFLDLSIEIPPAVQDKVGYAIYREHDGVIDKILTTPNKYDEFIEVNDFKTKIDLTINRFSAYALAYSNNEIDKFLTPEEPGVVTYTITFDENGGDVLTNNTTSTDEDGHLTSLPSEPTRSGYTFKGWYLEEGLTNEVTTSTTFSKDTTVYAKWEKDAVVETKYTIIFDSNGGSEVLSVETNEDGNLTSLPSEPTRSGYTFEGWFLDEDFTTEVSTSTTFAENTTVYAKWDEDAVVETKYTISFDSNGGSEVLDVETDVNGKLTSLPSEPTRSGYTFEGWFLDEDFTTEVSTSTTFAEDTTLYAKWKVVSTTTETTTQTTTSSGSSSSGSSSSSSSATTTTESTTESTTEIATEATTQTTTEFTTESTTQATTTESSTPTPGSKPNPTAGMTNDQKIEYYIPVLEKFDDLQSTYWGFNSIGFVVDRNYFNGINDSEFKPEDNMNRAMVVTVLSRIAEIDANDTRLLTGSSFSDVPAGSWYEGAVNWAVSNNITSGKGNGFDPDGNVTRQEMAVFFSRFAQNLGVELPEVNEGVEFADSGSIESWATEQVSQLQRAGIINGKLNNLFDPTGTATRTEVATMVERFVELIESTQE